MRDERLRELAILGLEAERQRIDDELAALRSRGTVGRPPGKRGRKPASAAGAEGKPRKARRKMSPAKRKALSERMKRIWAERRKGK
jgi:hypothetical protein